MSEKERLHKAIFEMVKQGRLTLEKAANQVGLSYRQAKRIYKRYKVEGGAGLMHKLRGEAESPIVSTQRLNAAVCVKQKL